jgi:hypothetical protein
MQQSIGNVKRAARYLAVLAFSAAMVAGSGLSVAGYAGYSSGADSTTLSLDRDGADVFSAAKASPTRGMDTTTLYLDRDGADIPEGNWWGSSDYAGDAVAAPFDGNNGPGSTTLNLDRDGADVSSD